VDDFKPLPMTMTASAAAHARRAAVMATSGQGLTLADFRAQLEDLGDISPTLELNLSTFRTRPRVNLSHMGDKAS